MGDLFQAAWETVDLALQIRHERAPEAAPEEPLEKQARVLRVEGRSASLEYDDGRRETIEVPQRVGAIDVGMRVRVVEHGDGRVLYLWDPPSH